MGRRAVLRTFPASDAQHPGLWLQRYVSSLERETTEEKARHIRETCQIPVPSLYRCFLDRWKNSLIAGGALVGKAECDGRMVVGLGNESVLETAISLHHTYGVPLIPGSALKGLASSFASCKLESPLWRKSAAGHRTVFGTTEQAGYVVFHDALYLPTGSGKPLFPDVVTTHHPDYYQRDPASAEVPADWDSPIPVPFVSCTGSFLVAISGPGAWTSAVWKILQVALKQEGIGAKTSRGYGRLTLGEPERVAASQSPPTGLPDEIARIPDRDVKSRIGNYVDRWRKMTDPSEKLKTAEAILARVEKAGWKDAHQKSWHKEIRASLKPD